MALPFANPISQAMPGFGSPSYYGAATQTPTTTAAVTLTIANTATTPSASGIALHRGQAFLELIQQRIIRICRPAEIAGFFAAGIYNFRQVGRE